MLAGNKFLLRHVHVRTFPEVTSFGPLVVLISPGTAHRRSYTVHLDESEIRYRISIIESCREVNESYDYEARDDYNQLDMFSLRGDVRGRIPCLQGETQEHR